MKETLVFAEAPVGSTAWEIVIRNPNGSGRQQLTFNQISGFPGGASADGLKIVIDGWIANGEIWSIEPDGSNPVNLSNHAAEESVPTIDQNGKIVFVSDRDGDDEIFIMDANGSNQTQLTINSGIEDDSPMVSWDGARIVYKREGNIWIMDSDGTDQTKLTNFSAGAFTVDPCFNATRTKIAFISNADGGFDLFTMDADGNNLVNHTSSDAYGYRGPAYSVDGNHIFIAASPPSGNQDIYRFDANGSNRVQITNTAVTEARPRVANVFR